MDHTTETKASKGPKACTTCAKAKSRCIPGPTGDICERCHRLNKPCSAQTPAPPRKRKAPRPTRVAELEKRLEDLTARVESGQAFPPTPSDAESPVEGEERQKKMAKRAPFALTGFGPPPSFHCSWPPGSLENQDQPDPREISRVHRGVATSPSGAGTPVAPSSHEDTSRNPSPAYDRQAPAREPRPHRALQRGIPLSGVSAAAPGGGLPDFYPGHEEGQRILEAYGPRLVTIFPFVVIPREIVTSEQLLQQRPFLWKGVMMSDPLMEAKRQFLMGNDLLNDIVTATFVRPRKSIDLLQSLQLLIAWFHINSNSFRVTNFLYLMRSICTSLGFNESQGSLKQQGHDHTSLEHMRAFAGVYYLVTMAFTTNKMPDAFMSPNFALQCCRVLEENHEYPTDQLAVLLVRTQQLSQSISVALAFRDSMNSMPLKFLVNAFEREIEQFRASIPEALQQHSILITQLHVVEILLYEVAVGEEASASLLPTERFELLWKCVRAVRSQLEARFFMQPDVHPRSFCLASFDYTYGMLVGLKLSTLDLPGWDLRVVGKQLDTDKYLILQIQELLVIVRQRNQEGLSVDGVGGGSGSSEAAGAVQQRQPSFQDPYKRLLTKLIQLRACIVAELAASMPAEPEQQSTTDTSTQGADTPATGDAASAHMLPDMTALFGADVSGDVMQGLDDPFWKDMMDSAAQLETSFNALLGWGSDDLVVPAYSSWTGDMSI